MIYLLPRVLKKPPVIWKNNYFYKMKISLFDFLFIINKIIKCHLKIKNTKATEVDNKK